MSQHNNQITHCIYYNMPFTAFDQFTAIEPRFPNRFRGSLDGLAIDNSGARILVPTDFFPKLLVNRRVNLLQNIVVNPFMIVIAYHRVMRKIFRQISPLAARLVEIKNCIQYFTKIVFPGPARLIWIESFQKRLYDLPLFIG